MDKFLLEKGFIREEEGESDYEHDIIGTILGFTIGTYMPNFGCLTVEICVDKIWFYKSFDGIEGWDYKQKSVREKATEYIKEFQTGVKKENK